MKRIRPKLKEDEEASLRKPLLSARITSGLALLALLGVVLSVALSLDNHAKASGFSSAFINVDSSLKRASVTLEVLSREQQESSNLSFLLVAVVFGLIVLFSLFSAVWIYRRRHLGR